MTDRPRPRKVRFVCISDTHNHRPGEGFTLPKGDVLIHAGDLTNQGSYHELEKAAAWLEKADFAVKIVVAGNHDLSLDRHYTLKHDEGWKVTADNDIDRCHRLLTSIPNLVYLEHSSSVVNLASHNITFHVFGSPYSPARGKQNWAFQYSAERAETQWQSIPADVEVVITHTPPAGHVDASRHWNEGGCTTLLKALGRVRPVLHVCGHCHEGRGAEIVRWNDDEPGGVNDVRLWEDPGEGNKKISRLDFDGRGPGGIELRRGKESAIINASIMAKSFEQGGGGGGGKAFNKPIVVDVDVATFKDQVAAGS